jgi:hypothetical protein
MNSRSSLGKTSKYSGVVKNVQGNKPPEEPRITQEQVVAAFKSFGFTPNERNHNDIGYWTMKGQSEGIKLMEELHKRRQDINKEEDDGKKAEAARNKAREDSLHKHEEVKQNILNKQTQDKIAMPRLSDEDIKALFDEYGLPTPDPEWARNHMPNDPKKVRSLLEVQRKMADDMIKKSAKNTVNALPETPKMAATPTGGAAPMPMMGQGGPSPMGIQGSMTPDTSPATPFFIGDHSIVKIVNPNNPNQSTTWLVDSKKKVLRPFESEEAFQNAFEDPTAAEKAVITLTSKDLGPGGVLDGFTPLQNDKAVKSDGSMDNIDFSEGEIQQRYGQTGDPAAESRSLAMLDGLFGKINGQQPQ